jgi:hypothetical protein
MASSAQGMRTFGDKPKPFQIEDGGEYYYVGSEVSNVYSWAIRVLSQLAAAYRVTGLNSLTKPL